MLHKTDWTQMQKPWRECDSLDSNADYLNKTSLQSKHYKMCSTE